MKPVYLRGIIVMLSAVAGVLAAFANGTNPLDALAHVQWNDLVLALTSVGIGSQLFKRAGD